MVGYGYSNQVPPAVPLGGIGPAPVGYGGAGGFWYAFLIILFIVIILFWGFWAFGSYYR